jgi:hypothetical protein
MAAAILAPAACIARRNIRQMLNDAPPPGSKENDLTLSPEHRRKRLGNKQLIPGIGHGIPRAIPGGRLFQVAQAKSATFTAISCEK